MSRCHPRRCFMQARASEPEAIDKILDAIGALFPIEEKIREVKLDCGE